MQDKLQGPINIYSDIGQLKSVLLHRPGQELERLMPENFESLLFDDIPYLADAQKEHDQFAAILERKGVEVLYLDKLAAEALENDEIKNRFIDDWLAESALINNNYLEKIRNKLENSTHNLDLVHQTMRGFAEADLYPHKAPSIESLDYQLLINPIPNLYFTRDPFVAIGNGMAINKMYSKARSRETLYADYIFNYHPRFFEQSLPKYYDRRETTFIEGGDIIVVSEELILIGVSQRTELTSVKKIAKMILKQSNFQKIIVVSFVRNRKFMHLDTVFTMLDKDKFLIHPEIEFNANLISIENIDGQLSISKETEQIKKVLQKELDLDHIQFIRCGGNDPIANAREQWSDGANTLALGPSEVIVYDRNPITNNLLEEAGIKLHKIKSSELVRGRGGPRCMSMALHRAEL